MREILERYWRIEHRAAARNVVGPARQLRIAGYRIAVAKGRAARSDPRTNIVVVEIIVDGWRPTQRNISIITVSREAIPRNYDVVFEDVAGAVVAAIGVLVKQDRCGLRILIANIVLIDIIAAAVDIEARIGRADHDIAGNRRIAGAVVEVDAAPAAADIDIAHIIISDRDIRTRRLIVDDVDRATIADNRARIVDVIIADYEAVDSAATTSVEARSSADTALLRIVEVIVIDRDILGGIATDIDEAIIRGRMIVMQDVVLDQQV